MAAPSPFSESFPPAPQWTADNVPDQTGRVCIWHAQAKLTPQVAIVTGGNSGIGLETVRALLRKHATVYIAARNAETAAAAIDAFQKDPSTAGGKVTFLPLDLASFRSIESFVRAFRERENRLDLLFNSAGVIFPELGRVTAEGYEIHFGTNALGHYYLTKLLLPFLRESAKTSPTNPPRVCFTSSFGHNAAAKGFDPADPAGVEGRSKGLKGSFSAYAHSKMGNVLSAFKFQREYGKEGIVFTAVNPGNLKTNISRSASGILRVLVNYIITPVLLYRQEYGAITQLYANTAPETQGDGGAYFVPWARRGEPRAIAKDTAVQDKFASWCEEQIAAHPPPSSTNT